MAFIQDIYSTDFTRNSELRYMKYKNYEFVYNPQRVTTSEDSRLAEYQYLFIDGADYSKLRGARRVVLDGVLIAGPLDVETVGRSMQKKSESFQIMQKFIDLANNQPGPLVLAEHGVYDNALISNWEFSEDGAYNKELSFRLEFIILTRVPTADRVAPVDQKTQEELPDEDKTNFCYTIVAGDTLSGIASRFGMTLSAIKAQRPEFFDARHRGGNLIFPGEEICLKKGSALSERPTPAKGTATMKTVKGASDIPKDARLCTFVDNKDKEVRSNSVIVGVINAGIEIVQLLSKGNDSYIGAKPGDTINQSVATPQSSVGNMPTPRQQTTYDKYIQTNTALQTPIPKMTVFPAFEGLVQYPKDRTNKATSIKPAFLNPINSILGR